MPKRRTRYLCAALLATALVAWVLWPGDKEPYYQGRSLSYWIDTYATANNYYDIPNYPGRRMGPPQQESPAQAVHQMGPAALPCLVKWLRRQPTTFQNDVTWLRSLLARTLGKYFPKFLTFPNPLTATQRGVIGFIILGPSARAAIPELEHLAATTRDRPTAQRALEALCSVGPEAVPTIVALMTNPHTLCRCDAIRLAKGLGTNTTLVMPAILHNLRDPDPAILAATIAILPQDWPARGSAVPTFESFLRSSHSIVRTEAILRLRQNPTSAAQFIPLLKAALADADPAVRMVATNTLSRIPSATSTDAPTH